MIAQSTSNSILVNYDEKDGDELTVIASFSPTRGVTKPSKNRPTVIPSQKPVAVIPLAKAGPFRTRIMKVTIHPPKATSTPT